MLCFLPPPFFFQAIYNVWLPVNAGTRRDYVGAALTSVSSLLMLMPSVRRRLIFPAAVTFARSILREGVPKGSWKRDSFSLWIDLYVRSFIPFLSYSVAQSLLHWRGNENLDRCAPPCFVPPCFYDLCFQYSFKK